MKAKIGAWLRDPTTIAGLATILGTIAGIVGWFSTKNAPAAVAFGGAIAGAFQTVMPSNANANAVPAAQVLVQDVVSAAVQKHIAATMPVLMQDIQTLLAATVMQSIAPAPAPVPVPVPVAPAPAPVPQPPASSPAAANA